MECFKKIILLVVLCVMTGYVDCFSQSQKQDMPADGPKEAPKGVETVDTDRSESIKVMDRLYLFGVAKSYADSVTIITDISEVVGLKSLKEDNSIIGLNLYTKSLKDYLLTQGKKGYLCSTFVCESRKEAEKRILSIRAKVNKSGQTRLESAGDFQYKLIDVDHIFTNENVEYVEEDENF